MNKKNKRIIASQLSMLRELARTYSVEPSLFEARKGKNSKRRDTLECSGVFSFHLQLNRTRSYE